MKSALAQPITDFRTGTSQQGGDHPLVPISASDLTRYVVAVDIVPDRNKRPSSATKGVKLPS
jgi:hypothetical protein